MGIVILDLQGSAVRQIGSYHCDLPLIKSFQQDLKDRRYALLVDVQAVLQANDYWPVGILKTEKLVTVTFRKFENFAEYVKFAKDSGFGVIVIQIPEALT